jgi:lysophospholipase L1-like esterase
MLTVYTRGARGAFFPDKLHPNAAGAERFAERVAAAR